MPKLVVAEAQSRCGSALIEAVAVERILEQLALIIRDGGAEVARGGRRSASRFMALADQWRGRCGRGTARHRCPGRMEWIELDLVDLTLRVLVAIDRALDRVAQLANIARPMIGLQRGHRARREPGPV